MFKQAIPVLLDRYFVFLYQCLFSDAWIFDESNHSGLFLKCFFPVKPLFQVRTGLRDRKLVNPLSHFNCAYQKSGNWNSGCCTWLKVLLCLLFANTDIIWSISTFTFIPHVLVFKNIPELFVDSTFNSMCTKTEINISLTTKLYIILKNKSTYCYLKFSSTPRMIWLKNLH